MVLLSVEQCIYNIQVQVLGAVNTTMYDTVQEYWSQILITVLRGVSSAERPEVVMSSPRRSPSLLSRLACIPC